MCMKVYPGFLLIGERSHSPDCFIITANATDSSAAMRRTVCRRQAPLEDDAALWSRVVDAALVLRRQVEADPWYQTAGLIDCIYASPQACEDPAKDERWNDIRAFLRMAQFDASARARAYAQGVLIRMLFGEAMSITDPGDTACAQ